MNIGNWTLTILETIYSWINKLPSKTWTLPIRLLGNVLLFVAFQVINFIAQIRWPFSAVVRLINSFQETPSGYPIPVNEIKLFGLLKKDIPVLVDFWTEWCGPCVAMEGIIKGLAKSYEGRLVVAKVDATINPKLTKKYNVMGYPTLILFINGKEVSRHTGALSYKWLVSFVEQNLHSSSSVLPLDTSTSPS
jgi:thioredoxin 1